MTQLDRTPTDSGSPAADLLAQEIAVEQDHVDRVYAELSKATDRARLVEADGMSRGRTERTGDVRDEESAGLFERDAMVYAAARRQHVLDQQYEGLVFGRLDLDDQPEGAQVRHIGRLGVRDDDYEPLVIDWRAPAAGPFYRATPVERLGVVRRRVLTCRGERVVGVEDDLMVPEAPEGMAVVGEGALLAALGRSRSGRMRDIVATIQAHQDEAIRASARGVTELTGGPGTGKTVVALHRAAYLLYSDRRRFESGGILVVGPSSAYTAYIERVLPSLGEESVTLRSVGDLVDAVTATRVDDPATAAVKGSLRMRRVLKNAALDAVPGAPTVLRVMVKGHAVRLEDSVLGRVRARALRGHLRNAAAEVALDGLATAAWQQAASSFSAEEREEFIDVFTGHPAVEEFMAAWWPQLDPREVLLWLADETRARRYGGRVLDADEVRLLSASYRQALEGGTWSVADVSLIDDMSTRLGPVRDVVTERGFYEVEDLDDIDLHGVAELGTPSARWGRLTSVRAERGTGSPRDRLLRGRIDPPSSYAHILVDEAQDLSPMQWRALGRRGRAASWTVVGDAAQASWPDAGEAALARDEAYGPKDRQRFHLATNYRNAREIFDYAAATILPVMPDADIPEAVRESGVEPVEVSVSSDDASVSEAITQRVAALAGEVDGAIAVIVPERWHALAGSLEPTLQTSYGDRVSVIDPLSTKGLEWDATVVVDPAEITATSPGGARVLYVCLTRAAHRMHVITL